MTVCGVCHTEVGTTHTHFGVETCRVCRVREVTESVERHLFFEEAQERVREGVAFEAENSQAFATVLALARG